jgi:hypothetical protein
MKSFYSANKKLDADVKSQINFHKIRENFARKDLFTLDKIIIGESCLKKSRRSWSDYCERFYPISHRDKSEQDYRIIYRRFCQHFYGIVLCRFHTSQEFRQSLKIKTKYIRELLTIHRKNQSIRSFSICAKNSDRRKSCGQYKTIKVFIYLARSYSSLYYILNLR